MFISISEFSSSSSLIWSTYRGGPMNDYLNAVSVGGVDFSDIYPAPFSLSLVDNIFVGGQTYSAPNTYMVMDNGISMYNWLQLPTNAPLSSSSDGYFCIFDYLPVNSLVMSNYYSAIYSSDPVASQVHTAFNAIANWGSHAFYNGYTTNNNYKKRAVHVDMMGNVSAWNNAWAWQFNQNQSYNINNIPSDIAMFRFSPFMGPMFNSVEETEPKQPLIKQDLPSLVFPNPQQILLT